MENNFEHKYYICRFRMPHMFCTKFGNSGHSGKSDIFTHLPTICQIRLILSQIILFFETFDNQNKMDHNIFSIQQEFNVFGLLVSTVEKTCPDKRGKKRCFGYVSNPPL